MAFDRTRQTHHFVLEVLTFLIVCCWWSLHALRADEALDKKVLSMGSQYEGLRILGTINAFSATETKPKQQFEVLLGYPKNPKQARPFSVSLLVPNPGEPHLTQRELADYVHLSDGFISGEFTRSYISTPPQTSRYSEMELRLPGRSGRLETRAISLALQYWVDGRDSLGIASAIANDVSGLNSLMDFKVEGKEDFQGFETHLLSLTIPHASATLQVALEPTVQIIACTEHSQNALCFDMFDRKVETLKVFDGVLMPTSVTITYGREEKTDGFTIDVDSVEKIDRDYPAMWKFNDLTGVFIVAPPGMLDQLVSVGIPQGRFQRAIQHSQEEQELIRRYVLANTSMVTQPTSWGRLVFYAVNLAAGLVLIYAVWRKTRNEN